ncbi:GNAT family N-acetyltransferase [Chitinophaga sp. Cy-1792]|uniref:GNAT family N-acetyltransferase n=1 Tax=Chitinophaga sp. Cy-1792 TaxID=2608339 RepID=UPI00141FB8C6|nr:GNAT family N-acetyltransferase [Chitinophaga sp. Cy-1792]NIG53765.1 GNAT family N-acetyltransferase [Chitinophaga sp. Cy-1792]
MTVYQEGPFSVSTDKDRLDIDVIYNWLSNVSYWAKDIPREIVERAIAGSMCFGVYHEGALIGFGRLVTDKATFAYLMDVFILEEWRGKGLSKMLMQAMLAHPELQDLRRWLLMTTDAHGLYSKFGFAALPEPGKVMTLARPNPYAKKSSE